MLIVVRLFVRKSVVDVGGLDIEAHVGDCRKSNMVNYTDKRGRIGARDTGA